MNAATFNRLHSLRMANDAAGFDMAEMKPRFDRLSHRHENGTAPRAVVAFQLFQTPPEIAARLVAAAGTLPENARILEPSAGLGRILDAIASAHPTAETVAVEMASQCAGELFTQNRERVIIKQRDFLACSVADIGQFDAVFMNPPFHMRADVRHILHARQFLKPGGVLAALCLHTHHRTTALQPSAASWEALPGDTFAREGTHVETILLTLRNK